jgi:hypothetical protein
MAARAGQLPNRPGGRPSGARLFSKGASKVSKGAQGRDRAEEWTARLRFRAWSRCVRRLCSDPTLEH